MSSSQPHRPAFPQRRRPRGPLHPPNRPAPSPVSTLSSSSGSGNPSFIAAAPNKKRNWTPGIAGPSTATSSVLPPLDQPASSSAAPPPPWTQQPYRSASSDSWYYDAQAQLAGGGPSRSGSSGSLYYDAPSSSTTSTSNPLQPPQGEFSFESRRRGTMGSGTWDVSELPDSDGAGLGPGRSAQPVAASTSTIPASPARASLQRAQERERAAAAAAANGAGPASASSSGIITSEQAADEHVEGPAPKKRRGVAGAIVEGALHTALYAGAAAITAYTLWSSWGRRSPGEDEQPSAEEEAARKKANEKQTLPGTLSEEPPPPYAEGATMSPSPSTSSLPSSSRGGMLTQRVYVSSHRRRPALPPARHARVEQARRNRHAARQGLASASGSGSASTVGAPPLALEPQPTEEDDGDEGEDDEYSRMSRQMAALIKEGQAALSAQVDIGDMEDDEEDDVGSTSVLGGMPKSRSTGSTGGLGLIGTPGRLRLGAEGGRGDSPLRARASTSGATPSFGGAAASGSSWSTYALPEPSKAAQPQTFHFDFANSTAASAALNQRAGGMGTPTRSIPPSPSAPSLGYTATNPFARHGSLSSSQSLSSTQTPPSAAAPFVFGSSNAPAASSGVPASASASASASGTGTTPSSSVFGASSASSPFGAHGRLGSRPSPYARSGGAGGLATPPNRKPRWH